MTSRNQFIVAMSFSVATIPIFTAPALAAPTGHLGYLKQRSAIVSDARTGRETRLPRGTNVGMLRLSPRGEALYFAGRPGEKPKNDWESVRSDGMLAKPPYRTARQLPALTGVYPDGVEWNRRGDTIYFRSEKLSGALSPLSRRFTNTKRLPSDTSRDGRVLVYVDDGAIRVKDAMGKEHRVLSVKQPKPLFDAINNAKYPKGAKDLKDEISPDLWKEPNNWQLDAVALAPDGKRLYFASNAGTGMGAAGNANWMLFACDLTTYKIAVLSKVGVFFSRSPDVLTVSPDGRRLIVQSSTHSSAIDNPSTVFVIDLLTQNSRELLLKQAPKGTDTNLGGGAVWSPDSKYVAFSGLFYSMKALEQKPDSDWDVDPKAWRLFVADAATGKIVRVIPGATAPSWGR